MIPQEHLPDWWLQSGLYAWLSGVSVYRMGLWNHLCAAVVVMGSVKLTLRKAGQGREPARYPHDSRPNPLRRRVLVAAWILGLFQFMWAALTGSALDRGYMFMTGSVLWGMVALIVASMLWLSRRGRSVVSGPEGWSGG